MKRTRTRKILRTAAGFVLVASTSTSAALSMQTAASAAVPASGAYTGNAAADLVHVDAFNVPGTIDLANATVAPVTSAVSTATSPRVTSDATNANLQLFSKAINQNLLVEAKQSAPPDNATGVHSELLSVPAAPLLTASVATADAHSRWNADDSCLTSGPLSTAISKVADAVVLPNAPGIGDVVSLNNHSDPSGAVVSDTSVGLVKQPATAANDAVRTTSSTQITSVNLFGGALVVDVVTAPKVVATATGVAGTSTVQLTQPVLRINGQTLIDGSTIKPLNIPGAPLVELTAGNLTSSIAADGTSATGTGNLLTLKVLDVTGTITLLKLTIGDVTATATAPAGGVDCSGVTANPLRDARKDATATTVNPGEPFDYSIVVPNRGSADITDVKVVDTVSGTPPLILVGSVPAPVSTSGSTYTFELGTISPNQVKTITMTFKVPEGTASGTKYSNTAVITGTYAGQTVSKTVISPYPTVDAVGTGGCDLSRSTKFASHVEVTPGEEFTYTINVFNQGAQDCTGVVVTDTLNSGVSFVACNDGCTASGQDLTWHLGTVAAGGGKELLITVKTVATSGTLPNAALITPASGIPGNPSTAGPTVGTTSVLSPGNPATRLQTALANTNGGATGALRGGQVFGHTGGSPLLTLGGVALLALAGLARRRLAL